MHNDAPYRFADDQLTEIAFPLGGIGTGCISLEGRGAFRDWEIFGKPNKNSFLGDTFAALYTRTESGAVDTRVIQSPRLKDFLGDADQYGMGHVGQAEGLPCFESARFLGKFPFAEIEFSQPKHPLQVTLRAFSPFIPLDDRSSSLPVASLTYVVKNQGNEPVEVLLAFCLQNPVGMAVPVWSPEHDQAQATFRDHKTWRGLTYTNARYAADSVFAGDVTLSTDWPDVTYTERWYEGGWWDGLQDFWNRFSKGTLNEASPNQLGARKPAVLGLRVKLAPGESAELPFLLAWIFPNADRYWDTKAEPVPAPWKKYYATEWPDSAASTAEFFSRKAELTSQSQAFQDALFGSDLPPEIIARIAYSASTLRTPTVDRLADGTLWAWEGCNPHSGCCHGSCSHVWNYALTHAYLFPDLYRTMLTSHFDQGFNCGPLGERGAMNFRIMLPLATPAGLWHAAIDGQLGLVVQLYRTWQREGNEELLKTYWPKAKAALEFAWVQWDRDQDGLVDGDMHNTYDINFQGPNPLGQFFYLAALRAGAAMAGAMDEPETAARYAELATAGVKLTEEKLWNGDYYEQRLEQFDGQPPKYQHGTGCLSDQLFGILCARVAEIDGIANPDHVKSALQAIFRENFRNPIGDHVNLQRSYVARDEAGLLLCSWPQGGKLEFPFVYSDEVWTGIEYQIATHLVYEGFAEEALAIIRAIAIRHDGRRRNPYNEVECGSHYARALASYGLLLAWPVTGPRFHATPTEWGIRHPDGQFDVLGKEAR